MVSQLSRVIRVVRNPAMLRPRLKHLGVVFYNLIVTHIPSHQLRLGFLRMFGAEIGAKTSIFRGTTVFGIENLRIGAECGVGFRCLLDARGGLVIGDRVVVASDVQFITAGHDFNDPAFTAYLGQITVADYVWITTRAVILAGSSIGRGAVVAANAVVNGEVEAMTVVGGVPAKLITRRTAEPDYSPAWRPWGF